jgi:hypothetical protein
MEANNERMPGDAEAAAAVEGMQDLYGRDLRKGSDVWYRREEWPAGRAEGGVVLGFHRGLILVETATDVVEVSVEELMPF